MKKRKNLTSLDQLIEVEIGPIDSKKRDKFEKGYEAFKLGVLLQQARQARDQNLQGFAAAEFSSNPLPAC